MTKAQPPAIPYQVAPDYPSYDQALAYAEDFRTGAANAYEKGEGYARYWLSSLIDILATLLHPSIYTVVAHPPGGFEFADTDEVELLEYFRGWILQYQEPPGTWNLLASSQEVGIDEFIRLRRQYKQG